MTDRRVTDLSYGHPGKATYDIETKQWNFSIDFKQETSIQQLLPFQEWISPSIQYAPKSEESPSKVAQSQIQKLVKARPETFPANTIALTLMKAPSASQVDYSNHPGSLLAVGRAVDVSRISGSRRPQIFAIPHGAAGHILRLIKPRLETRGWGKQSGARLRLLSLDSPETGYWIGIGGTIRQIVFADVENEPGTWLAVRQTTVITIFEPTYGHSPTSSAPLNEYRGMFSESMLNANPVATLTSDRTNSTIYSDVSFNPWFARQVAVVDAIGRWSTWDLTRPHAKNSSYIFVPVKSGEIYDGYVPGSASKVQDPGHADGWYRVLWACDFRTIVICNRHCLSIFDLGGKPTRLRDGNIIAEDSSDWILDIKRSALKANHLFVLTTSRVIWVEVTPAKEAGQDQNDPGGAKVILSYQHHRDANDETMKLTTIKNAHVSVMLTSAKHPLVNYYCFRKEQSSGPTSWKGSFTLSLTSDKGNRRMSLQTAQFVPCELVPHLRRASGPGLEYIEQGISFFQLWVLTSDLGLSSTLSVVSSSTPERGVKKLSITAPKTRLLQISRRVGPKFVHDDFIVPDDLDEEGPHTYSQHTKSRRGQNASKGHDDLRFTLDWRRIYQKVVTASEPDERISDSVVRDGLPGMVELLNQATDHIRQRIETDELANETLAEITGVSSVEGELEEAALALRNFLESLELDHNPDTLSKLVITNLFSYPGVELPFDPESKYPDLLKVFDHLVAYWMANLPLQIPNLTRLSKFKVIRQLAIELCMSSIGIFLQNRAASVSTTSAPTLAVAADGSMAASTSGKDDRTTRDSSPALFSSQLAALQNQESHSGLPTPTTTPSIYSHATSASELKEDPAITRLRQYAVFKPKLGFESYSAVLSHWPATPGADPAEYSYEAAKKAFAAEQGGEEEHRNRKEEARRRRRTEKFLRQDRARAAEQASQPMDLPFGSQPEILQNAFSSQVVDDGPMTQPDRGAFGSRAAKKGKKKQKKQRTAGF